jgi:hypothetical protein
VSGCDIERLGTTTSHNLATTAPTNKIKLAKEIKFGKVIFHTKVSGEDKHLLFRYSTPIKNLVG